MTKIHSNTTITSSAANTSWLRFVNLTSAAPSSNSSKPLWVNATWDVVAIDPICVEITQAGHWLAVMDWVRFDEATGLYVLAQANNVNNLWHRHVTKVIDANTICVAKNGTFNIVNTLPEGEYILDQWSAGWYTQTLPTSWILLYGMEVIDANTVNFYTVTATDAAPVVDETIYNADWTLTWNRVITFWGNNLKLSGIPSYANDWAAGVWWLTTGDVYWDTLWFMRVKL